MQYGFSFLGRATSSKEQVPLSPSASSLSSTTISLPEEEHESEEEDQVTWCDDVQLNMQDKSAAQILLSMTRSEKSKQVIGLTRTKKPGTIACPQCERFFSRQCDLTRHLVFCGTHRKLYRAPQIAPSQGIEPQRFFCTMCTSVFLRKNSLLKHFRDAHNVDMQKPRIEQVSCEFCSKKFVRSEDLARHQRYHCPNSPILVLQAEKNVSEDQDKSGDGAENAIHI